MKFNGVSIVALASCFFLLAENAAQAQQWANNGTDIYNTNTGNVGIGITTPGYPLHVNRVSSSAYSPTTGQPNTAAILYNPTSGASNSVFLGFATEANGEAYLGLVENTGNTAGDFAIKLWSGTDRVERFRILSNGSVGIGTTAPTEAFVVSSDPGNIKLGPRSFLGSTYSSQGTVLGNAVRAELGANSNRMLESVTDTVGASVINLNNGLITFHTKSGATTAGATFSQEKVRIDTSGNVGIGTATPLERLHVVGNVVVSGNISAKYQDIAEWVSASQPIPSGSVVILDPYRTNSVLPCFKPYDTRVAGVISSNPGIVLGEAAEGKVKVATTGRAKVRVDATRAPIRIGDLLVTGEIEGVAMRSQPVDFRGVEIHRPGTLIGKALEPMERGAGEILVLLSLQ